MGVINIDIEIKAMAWEATDIQAMDTNFIGQDTMQMEKVDLDALHIGTLDIDIPDIYLYLQRLMLSTNKHYIRY